MPPVVRHHSAIAKRVQVLSLHAMGHASRIEELTGITRSAFKNLLRKAKGRGYVPGDKITDEHVCDAPRSGRPKIIGEVEAKAI
jgi:hypothetical protein